MINTIKYAAKIQPLGGVGIVSERNGSHAIFNTIQSTGGAR